MHHDEETNPEHTNQDVESESESELLQDVVVPADNNDSIISQPLTCDDHESDNSSQELPSNNKNENTSTRKLPKYTRRKPKYLQGYQLSD